MYEAQRHYGIIDARLGKQKYMVGDSYTIVDMALWGWARLIPVALGESYWAKFPNLKRLMDEINARPASARAIAIKDKHTFKAEFDDEARKAMFRHMHEKVM
jgi:Glutathione S-transferase